jgi:preprotein translocase subunit SecE
MAMRRTQRGGPAPASGARTPEGARLVKPASSKADAERMRQAMTPSGPSRARLLQEQLNLTFFQEAISELRKVHWPTRVQARNLTVLVIIVSLIIGVILTGIDFIFERVFEFILAVG